MATERLEITVVVQGAAAAATQIESVGKAGVSAAGGIERSMKSAEKSMLSMSSVMGTLRGALVAFAAIDIAKGVTEMADQAINASNKLILVTSNAKQLRDVNNEILQIANQTRQPLSDVAGLFQKMALFVPGKTFSQLGDATKALGEAALLSGTSTTQMTRAIQELSEGLGGAGVNGRILRSLLTDIPYLGTLIIKQLNSMPGAVQHTIADLRQMVEKDPNLLGGGKLFDILIKSLPELDANMGKVKMTFSGLFTQVTNNLDVFLGRLNETYNVTGKLNTAFQFMEQHVGQIVVIGGGLAAVFAFSAALGSIVSLVTNLGKLLALALPLGSALKLVSLPFTIISAVGTGAVAVIGGVVTAFKAMISPLTTIVSLSRALTAALFANPAFLIGAAVIGALALAWYVFKDQIQGVVDSLGGFSHIWDTIVNGAYAAVQTVIDLWKKLPSAMADVGKDVSNSVTQSDWFTSIVSKSVNGLNSARNYLGSTALGQAIGGGAVAPGPTDVTPGQVASNLNMTPSGSLDDVMANYKQHFNAGMATGTNPINTAAKEGYDKLLGVVTGIQNMMKVGVGNAKNNGAGESANDMPPQAGEGAPKSLFDDQKLMKLLGQFPGVQRDAKMSNLAEDMGMKPTAEGGTTPPDADLVKQMAALGTDPSQVLTREARALDGVGNATAIYDDKMKELKQDQDAGIITSQEYAKEIEKLTVTYLNSQTDFSSGVERTFLKMQEQANDVAGGVEKALTGAFSSAEDALIQFVNTGKINLKSLGDSITDMLLKSALNGVIGNIGASLFGGEVGKQNQTGGTIGALVSKITGGAFGNGGSVTDSNKTGASGMGGGGGSAGVLGMLGGLAKSAIGNIFGNSGLDTGPSNFLTAAPSSSGLSFTGGDITASDLGSSPFAANLTTGASIDAFADGGSFSVGANTSMGSMDGSGIDNRLIAFRARDGERVTVSRPGQSPGGTNINYTINTPDANSFRASQGQIISATHTGMMRAAKRNATA